MPSEADNCQTLIAPGLQATGWDTDPRSLAEQCPSAAGRIVIQGHLAIHRPCQRADYLLHCTRGFPIAVIEAKADDEPIAKGLRQAKEDPDPVCRVTADERDTGRGHMHRFEDVETVVGQSRPTAHHGCISRPTPEIRARQHGKDKGLSGDLGHQSDRMNRIYRISESASANTDNVTFVASW